MENKLQNLKFRVYSEEHSKAIQERLFELNSQIRWFANDREISNLDEKYLIIQDYQLFYCTNEELINITWKESNLWYLVRNKKTGVVTFKEHSSYGVWEGEITIK